MLWNSIPGQLAKENKKFIYGLVKEGARAKEYELALLWLTDCGLVHKIHRVKTPNYWTNECGTAEIDFVIDNGHDVIPVEVKAEQNLQAKSLKSYKEKFNPKISMRVSMADYKKEEWLINLPLYAVETIS